MGSSKVVFGTWGMSGDSYGRVDATAYEKALDTYLELGGCQFETASSYGMNRDAEKFLVSLLNRHKSYDGLHKSVITKVGNLPHTGRNMPQRWDEDFLQEQCEVSSKIFGDFLGGILLHSPPPDADLNKPLSFLKNYTNPRGLRFGVALRSTSDINNKSVLDALNSCMPDIVTLNFSLMDQRFLETFEVSNLVKSVKEFWARTVFNFGFLANPDLQIESTGDHRSQWSDGQIKAWRRGGNLYSSLAAEHGLSLTELAVGFVLSNPHLDRVCLGMSTPAEVIENLQAASIKISKEIEGQATELYKNNTFFVR